MNGASYPLRWTCCIQSVEGLNGKKIQKQYHYQYHKESNSNKRVADSRGWRKSTSWKAFTRTLLFWVASLPILPAHFELTSLPNDNVNIMHPFVPVLWRVLIMTEFWVLPKTNTANVDTFITIGSLLIICDNFNLFPVQSSLSCQKLFTKHAPKYTRLCLQPPGCGRNVFMGEQATSIWVSLHCVAEVKSQRKSNWEVWAPLLLPVLPWGQKHSSSRTLSLLGLALLAGQCTSCPGGVRSRKLQTLVLPYFWLKTGEKLFAVSLPHSLSRELTTVPQSGRPQKGKSLYFSPRK